MQIYLGAARAIPFLAAILIAASLAFTPLRLLAATDVLTSGVVADGKTDASAALQRILDSGVTDLYFPAGDYLLGGIRVPAQSRLSFAPKARVISVDGGVETVVEIDPGGRERNMKRRKPLFTVAGNDVLITGVRFDFARNGTDKVPFPTDRLVYASGVTGLTVSNFVVENTFAGGLPRGATLQLLKIENSRNIVLENSSADKLGAMIWADRCGNVTVRGNRMTNGGTITTFANGSESLRHHDNWSRGVVYQCVWRGGSPDPSRKAPKVPLGSAKIVNRGVTPNDAGWIDHTQGVFDVSVQNNYAEYGTVLCWGNKSRQTIISGNIARFMKDYSYGVEGGENLVFSNNISINSAVAGIMVMYWSEKVLISGNLVVVRHEPMDATMTDKPESYYQGQFIRLHHGPSNLEDQYGAGSLQISGNLFVNELSTRLSGISVEAGRDVLISGNKIINGLLRKADELSLVKVTEANKDMDEFQAQKTVTKEDGAQYKLLRSVGNDRSRLTVIGNEFILRQAGDKPALLVNGTVSSAIIKDNVFRKEQSHLTFTEAQLEMERGLPRYMTYADASFEERDPTSSRPSTANAIGIDAFTPVLSLVQNNVITGWTQAIKATNTTTAGRTTYLITGNTTDGHIDATGPKDLTVVKIEGNIELPLTVE
jgi:hypothetical protein